MQIRRPSCSRFLTQKFGEAGVAPFSNWSQPHKTETGGEDGGGGRGGASGDGGGAGGRAGRGGAGGGGKGGVKEFTGPHSTQTPERLVKFALSTSGCKFASAISAAVEDEVTSTDTKKSRKRGQTTHSETLEET